MKTNLIKYARRMHSTLLWIAFAALVIFVVSAITHLLMAWTGPKAKTFYPPAMQLDAELLQGIPDVLQENSITQAQQIKVIATEKRPLLQISQEDQPVRQYYSLIDKTLISDQDTAQATWLATYYTGLESIKHLDLITAFNADYPWVNRLLPVYKICFDDPDNTEVYVHTETNQLASISNDWKKLNRRIFVNLHTFSFLDDYPLLRVVIVSLLMLSLFTMLMTGISLLFLLKRRSKPKLLVRSHRWLAAILILPLLFLLISGLYHLYFYAFAENYRGLVLGNNQSVSLAGLQAPSKNDFLFENKQFNALSLITYQGTWYYRASIATEKQHQSHQRSHHFAGLSKESGSILIHGETGKEAALDDKQLAIAMAKNHLPFADEDIQSVEKITRFGMDYDFRNKRLPVYRVTLAEPMQTKLFIDTQSGILVDRVNQSAGIEGLSFSLLHKWNFLRPILPSKQRDMVVVCVLILILLLASLGVGMRFLRSPLRSKQAESCQHA